MHLWRISKFEDLSGKGGAFRSGRWHLLGTKVVYCSDHPSTALLEVLVHMDLDDLPPSYTLLKISCPDDLSIRVVSGADVDFSDLGRTQVFSDSLLRESGPCLLSVPSLVMPEARNILINPYHAAAQQISIETATSHPLDPRFGR